MTSQDTSGHLLRRRTTDRVIGGVAGGLGDYFNVDPLLFRIGFAALIIFGGAGLVLYLIAWVLLPAEGQDASILEGILRRLGLTPLRIGGIVLIVGVLALVLSIIGGADLSFPAFGERPVALWAVVVIAVGILLIRRREVAPATTLAATDATPRRAPRVKATPRPRSPLGWYVISALLLSIGVLALVSQAASVEVQPGQFFGAALAVIGIGLVVGAWWGRARILILLALLLLPIAITASFVTAPLEGGVADVRFAPVNNAELRTEYRLIGGRLVLDLTDLTVSAWGPVHIAASVAVGQLVVILPRGASVQLQSHVGAGDAIIFDSRDTGTSLEHRYVRTQPYGPTYVLDLQSGIGEVLVESEPTGVR